MLLLDHCSLLHYTSLSKSVLIFVSMIVGGTVTLEAYLPLRNLYVCVSLCVCTHQSKCASERAYSCGWSQVGPGSYWKIADFVSLGLGLNLEHHAPGPGYGWKFWPAQVSNVSNIPLISLSVLLHAQGNCQQTQYRQHGKAVKLPRKKMWPMS